MSPEYCTYLYWGRHHVTAGYVAREQRRVHVCPDEAAVEPSSDAKPIVWLAPPPNWPPQPWPSFNPAPSTWIRAFQATVVHGNVSNVAGERRIRF